MQRASRNAAPAAAENHGNYNPAVANSGISERLRAVQSGQNSAVKDLRRAFTQAELVNGCCAVEGTRTIDEVLRSGLKIHTLFVSESARDRASSTLEQIGKHTEALLLPEQVFASAVATEHPQGVAALVKAPQHTAEEILATPNGLFVVLGGVQDPGNVGTIIRSAEAFGAAGVLLTEGSVSHWNAKVIRAAAGSLFRLPVARAKSSQLLAQMRERDIRMTATVARKGTLLEEFDFRGSAAIWIGNEGAGLSRELLREIDSRISIPQGEHVESLNAGIAASIVLYEAARQRRRP